jgi:RNA polymerase sigma-70 factor (ECF subfamily)
MSLRQARGRRTIFGNAATVSTHSPSQQTTGFADLIVKIARDQDRSAFARLFEHFAPRIKTLLVRLGETPARAEDLAQDTLLTVWRKANLFDSAGASASGWIYRIAKNLQVDARRRDQRLSSVAAEDLDPVPLPDGIVSAKEMEDLVRAAVAELSEEQIRVVTLSFFEDKVHAEIADELKLPLGTVKSRLRLAMKHLRGRLDCNR